MGVLGNDERVVLNANAYCKRLLQKLTASASFRLDQRGVTERHNVDLEKQVVIAALLLPAGHGAAREAPAPLPHDGAAACAGARLLEGAASARARLLGLGTDLLRCANARGGALNLLLAQRKAGQGGVGRPHHRRCPGG